MSDFPSTEVEGPPKRSLKRRQEKQSEKPKLDIQKGGKSKLLKKIRRGNLGRRGKLEETGAGVRAARNEVGVIEDLRRRPVIRAREGERKGSSPLASQANLSARCTILRDLGKEPAPEKTAGTSRSTRKRKEFIKGLKLYVPEIE